MVSKKNFVAAAGAWFMSASWEVTPSDDRTVDAELFLNEGIGLFIGNVKDLKATSGHVVRYIRKMRALRTLTLRIGRGNFVKAEITNRRLAWEHELSELEVQGLCLTKSIGRMGQLKTLNLTAGWCKFATSDENKLTFEKNVETFERGSMKASRLRENQLPKRR